MSGHCGSVVLGAGVTGLAAGYATGFPVFEAKDHPGGICSTYYMRLGSGERQLTRPADGEAYRFELGGGHWIFCRDEAMKEFLAKLVPMKTYQRESAVYFDHLSKLIPYPIQHHAHHLEDELDDLAQSDIRSLDAESIHKDWLLDKFGPGLCELFFFPFHEAYTAGLFHSIVPQDHYKTPEVHEKTTGYNETFMYPADGLNALIARLREKCDLRLDKAVVRIDPEAKRIYFKDRTEMTYGRIYSSIPLARMSEICGVDHGHAPDPYTSVLVLNIAARRGPRCPKEGWLYIPRSRSGFYRVGFYSNIEKSFLPVSQQASSEFVSLYVERAFVGGTRLEPEFSTAYQTSVVEELQGWGFIDAVQICDPTWMEYAYTWTYPGSEWREKTLRHLADKDIHCVGRYGRWKFQGIAESIGDGLRIGDERKIAG